MIKRPKLDAYVDQIDQWLVEDKDRPRKQRHTAKRIFERLRDECAFDGGYTIVKDYVRNKRRGSREMFVPLSHPPGHAQADFGEALVVIGGVEQKAYFFALDLPHSDACYVRAYPAANTEAWLAEYCSADYRGPYYVKSGEILPMPKTSHEGFVKRTTLYKNAVPFSLVSLNGTEESRAKEAIRLHSRNVMKEMNKFSTVDKMVDFLREGQK